MGERVRIFVSSPCDVSAAREIAAQTIERLTQDFTRFVDIEPYLWEQEPLLGSMHYQDGIEAPSGFDIVILIVWTRLGTLLPKRTELREYCGIDGRTPVTGTEWEYENALAAARLTGKPEILVYRSRAQAGVDSWRSKERERQLEQLEALNTFWARHFANEEGYLGAFDDFETLEQFAEKLERSLRKLIERRIDRLVRSLERGAPKIWPKDPFRGLEAYDFEHAPIFFGQSDVVQRSISQLMGNAGEGSPFLLILGASGSGKSSLAKAGIVPRLFVPRRVSGTAFVRYCVFKPSDARYGEDVFDALARVLTTHRSDRDKEGLPELLGPGMTHSTLAASLRADPTYPFSNALGHLTLSAHSAGKILEHESARIVLVLDQLEELFTMARVSPHERLQFVFLIQHLVRSGFVWVIATMRKDFWHRADETPELVKLSEGTGRVDLLPPTAAQIGQMIQRPAEAAGVLFETLRDAGGAAPGANEPSRGGRTEVPLSEVIAQEVAHESGSLPLLSYLMDQLYRADVLVAGGNMLTFATYDRLGGISGVISTEAEAVLAKCSGKDRAALRAVLFNLIQISNADGDVDRAVARRVPLSNFPPDTAQRDLVVALLGARLLVSDVAFDGTVTIRVAHEALITKWALAREFVYENMEALRIRRRLEEQYSRWSELNRPEHSQTARSDAGSFAASIMGSVGRTLRMVREPGLLVDADLQDAQRIIRGHRSELPKHLVDFIDHSIADARLAGRRFVQVLLTATALFMFLAVVATIEALNARRSGLAAERQRDEAMHAQYKLEIQAAASQLQQDNPKGSLETIIPVLRNAEKRKVYDSDAVRIFEEALASDRERIVIGGFGGEISDVEFSPDGRRMVVASIDGHARVEDTLAGFLVIDLKGHSEPVNSAVFSPDGMEILTASDDGTARIWDAKTGHLIRALSAHRGPVTLACYSPDGRRLLTVTSDHSAQLWDHQSGLLLHVLRGHSGEINSAKFSSKGTMVATASEDHSVMLWDAETGVRTSQLVGHTETVWEAVFSPDDKYIASASRDGTAALWDTRSGARRTVFSGHSGAVFSVAFSPDGQRIVTGSIDKTARVWAAATGQQFETLVGHKGTVWATSFSHNGKYILTASWDHTARVWDATSGSGIAVFTGHADKLNGASFSADDRTVVTASKDATVRIWDVDPNSQKEILRGHTGDVFAAAYDQDGQRLVSKAMDHTTRVWNAHNGKELCILSGKTDARNRPIFTPNGQQILDVGNDHIIRSWDSLTGSRQDSLLNQPVVGVSFSPDGRQLALMPDSGPVVILNLANATKPVELGPEAGVVWSATFVADGRRIATKSNDGATRVWDTVTGKLQFKFMSDPSSTIAFSPDGNQVVTGWPDHTLRIFDTRTRMQLSVLFGHTDVVYSAAYSTDGKRIVTSSRDMTARIWDSNSGHMLLVLGGQDATMYSAAFSPDGREVVTASRDHSVRIWNAYAEPMETQITAAELSIPRELHISPMNGVNEGVERNVSKEQSFFVHAARVFESQATQQVGSYEQNILLLKALTSYLKFEAIATRPTDLLERRASLARVLIRNGMMQQVAEAYKNAIRSTSSAPRD